MRPIFLHTGWRTAGTLIWHSLRTASGFRTFYEPLHESLSSITVEGFGRVGPGHWNSAHPSDCRPYFEEFYPLLTGPRQIGVSGSLTRFAFDDFFLPPTAQDEKLRNYVSGLCNSGRQEGRVPVLKFTRSLGRLPWFRAQFPDALHPVIIREPWSQFRSAWWSRMKSRNGYFLAVPFLIMERNRMVPEVAALVEALDLPVSASPASDVLPRLEFWRAAVQRMNFEMLYRGSLALWLLNYAKALPVASFVLDVAAPIDEVQAVFAEHTGIRLGLERLPVPPEKPLLLFRNHKPLNAAMIEKIHASAIGALAPLVPEADLHRLAPWIDRAAASARRDLDEATSIVEGPSLAHAAGLFLDEARCWMKSQPGLYRSLAGLSRAASQRPFRTVAR